MNDIIKKTSVKPCKVPLMLGIGATISDSNAALYDASLFVIF